MMNTRRRWLSRRLALVVLALCVLAAVRLPAAAAWCYLPGVQAAARLPVMEAPGTVRVATKPIEPFVIKQGDQWTGFSIELWDEIARRMQTPYEWVGVNTVTEQLDAVEKGQVDVAMAGISMTAEREKKVDFSHPYFDAGLQILVAENARPSVIQYLTQVFTPSLLALLATVIVFSLVMAHIIWLVERGHNPDFPHGYFRGVAEGLWWLYMVIATGEYPDTEHSNQIKRALTVAWWLLGVALVAQLTGTIASNLTVQQLTSDINGPGDLPGRRVATVEGSTAAQYLITQGLSYVGVTRIEEAYGMLKDGSVQAVVYDAPVLQYYAGRKARGQFQVVGPIFKPEKYGIALAPGSPLRKPINEALLSIYQDGTYEALYSKWFGASM